MTDAEWQIVQPLLPPPAGKPGRPRADLREVLNAIFYVTDNSTNWRALPHDFPAWQTFLGWKRELAHDGSFERLADEVRTGDRLGERAALLRAR
ncbi:transposase [Kineococcus gypseus]|uniref:transposase n=1 Tax=Kineococcus gypseus TaxID=1637102 RepID=UPI003D7DE29A